MGLKRNWRLPPAMTQGPCRGLLWSARQAAGGQSLCRPLISKNGHLVIHVRRLHFDGRQRLSNVWLPSSSGPGQADDSLSKLIRAGFIRQRHAGLFQMLPLGLRVQEKIEKLIDKHMHSLGASKLALSSLSAQSLWKTSGRLSNVESELFRLTDRKGTPFLLAPTHEEEITLLASQNVQSYRDMPLRLYQITRKYRDELRPRHGLLRGREFLMKDLYTFDISVETALESYRQVQAAYKKLFEELKLPILVARASSGDMGGDLSHEYHLPSSLGDDSVVTCNSCDYVVNDELVETRSPRTALTKDLAVWRGLTMDRKTLVVVWYPAEPDALVNIHAVKSIAPDLDTSIEDGQFSLDSTETFKIINLVDGSIPPEVAQGIGMAEVQEKIQDNDFNAEKHEVQFVAEDERGQRLNLLRVKTGDECPKCASGHLKVEKAVELGHTFHLGTRYSEPLAAKVEVPNTVLYADTSSTTSPAAHTGEPTKQSTVVPLQMGCHGIGVTRLIGVVAHHLADDKGLNWPRKIAPYEVIVAGTSSTQQPELADAAVAVFDRLMGYSKSKDMELDAVLDDRNLSLGWKMKDADLVGYPVMVVVGKHWAEHRECEIQCRRLGVKERVGVDELAAYVHRLLDGL